MKRFTILIPIFNDWESLDKLLNNININIKNIKNVKFNCIVVDDCSTVKNQNIKVPKNINSIKIIHMNENRGHARCNAFGVKYLSKYLDLDYVILMVVAKRIKRSEGPIFQLLYRLHKYLTLLTTGKLINFGNYSCITKSDLKILSTKASLWSSFSGSFKKYIKTYNEIDSYRGMRYFGPSQMSLFKLAIHSLSIIAVFKYRVFLMSIVLLTLSYYLTVFINFNFLFFQMLLILFNLFIFIVSFRENEKELRNSESNINNIEEFTH